MVITLKNGQKEFENGMNALDIAGQLSQDLKKQAICARMCRSSSKKPSQIGRAHV